MRSKGSLLAGGRRRIVVAGPLAPFAESFRTTLTAQGYTRWIVAQHTHLMAHLSSWLVEQRLSADQLTAEAVGAFVAVRRAGDYQHDFRHSLAVRALLEWYRAGADVQARLPVLSTWLGHISPASTYYYLQAAPELLALAAERLEHPNPSTAAGALSWPPSRPSWKRSSLTG